MSNREKVLHYLHAIYPQQATNADIVAATKVEPHQQVFQITSELRKEGLISATRYGREWSFQAKSADASPPVPELVTGGLPPPLPGMDARRFESLARGKFSALFGQALHEGSLRGIPKRWDMLSDDWSIVGDAKYYKLVRGVDRPNAKFSTIAEHVWLLEKTNAQVKFLVLGNQLKVSTMWLKEYGDLVHDVSFYFMDDTGNITQLK